jgi:hypothetical protein
MAFAENAVKQIELGTKYIMAENNLPTEWYQVCADQAALIRNLLPLSRDVNAGDSDGDAIRPAEALSRGRISRRRCDHIMSHLTTAGTPCLVTMRKSTGSDIVNLARNRWGIFHHMVNDLPVFEDPRTKMHFHSKNYVSFEMPEGFSVYEYLGLPFPSLPKITHIRQGEHMIQPTAVVSIEGLGFYSHYSYCSYYSDDSYYSYHSILIVLISLLLLSSYNQASLLIRSVSC